MRNANEGMKEWQARHFLHSFHFFHFFHSFHFKLSPSQPTLRIKLGSFLAQLELQDIVLSKTT